MPAKKRGDKNLWLGIGAVTILVMGVGVATSLVGQRQRFESRAIVCCEVGDGGVGTSASPNCGVCFPTDYQVCEAGAVQINSVDCGGPSQSRCIGGGSCYKECIPYSIHACSVARNQYSYCNPTGDQILVYDCPAGLVVRCTTPVECYDPGVTPTPTNTPVLPTATGVPPTATPALAGQQPIGNHDPVVCSGGGTFRGWTCDPDRWSQALLVDFWEPNTGGTYRTGCTANTANEAAVTSLCGNTQPHRWVCPIPAALLNNAPHTVTAYAININSSGSPSGGNPSLGAQTFTCAPPPTPTPTRTPTGTPTPTSTNTPTPTPTLVPGPTKLRVKMQGGVAAVPVGSRTYGPARVTLVDGATVIDRTGMLQSVSGSGVWEVDLGVVPAASYSVGYIKTDGHLRRNLGAITVGGSGGTIDLTGKELRPGDFNGDYYLDGADVGLMLSKFATLAGGAPYGGQLRLFDVNNDGYLRLSDVAWVLANYVSSRVAGD